MATSLSSFFKGIAVKRLSAVEIKPKKSNQHEFNGSRALKELFGTEKKSFNGKFIFLTDESERTIADSGILTWYDARENHKTRTEHRLYYSTNEVISQASIGDLIVIGKNKGNQLTVIITPANSTTEKQLLWLFGIKELENNNFILKDFTIDKSSLDFAQKRILTTIGFEIEEADSNYLDLILDKFGNAFPKTSIFSEFARSTIKDVSPIEEPDKTLITWLDREEMLFKTLENHLVEKRLRQGFGKDGTDVDEFIKYSLSVQNRRKSRAGYAFENHLEKIFAFCKVDFAKKAKTENNNEPDFLFPSGKKYNDQNFNSSLLTMLALKTSAKERWRQILPEANRIWPKHLITLEPSISEKQTDQMRNERVQLVIPQPLFETYNSTQQSQIINLSDFITVVLNKQSGKL